MLLPMLGLTWVVGVFAVDSLSVPLYIFTIFNSLQVPNETNLCLLMRKTVIGFLLPTGVLCFDLPLFVR